LAGRSSHQHSYDAITINTIQLNTTASSCYIPADLSFKIIVTELGEHGKSRKKRAGLGDRPKEEMVADDKHIIKEQIRRHVKNQHPSPHKSVGEGVYQYKRRKHDEFNEGGCTCRDGQIADIFYLPKRLGSGGHKRRPDDEGWRPL